MGEDYLSKEMIRIQLPKDLNALAAPGPFAVASNGQQTPYVLILP